MKLLLSGGFPLLLLSTFGSISAGIHLQSGNGFSVKTKWRRAPAIVALAAMRGLKAISYLLDGAKETYSHWTIRHFEKSGGYSKAIEDFKSLKPYDVQDYPLLNGRHRTVGKVGDRMLILTRGGMNGKTTMEIRKTESWTESGQQILHTPKITDEITYID